MFSSNATQVSAVTQAEAVDFDGTNDYLSRSTDLTGNTNGKTFTLSAWVWFDGTNSNTVYYASGNSSSYFVLSLTATGNILVEGTNTVGSNVLGASYNFSALANFRDTFYNVLISVDLANPANRSMYVNDQAVAVTWTTYTNTNIAFSQPSHKVAGADGGANYRGRLSNFYFDKTYRDLSITANRRLFVTADLKPAAGQAALNPILYLPMSDPTTVGTNTGTGGNFTLTGTIARSGRGPNQYNAPYSDLDGTADYLSRTSLSGIADSKAFTLSLVVNADTSGYPIAFGSPSSDTRFAIFVFSDQVQVYGYGTAGASILVAQAVFTGQNFYGRNIVINISIDLADSAKRHIYVNGQVGTNTYSTYVNALVDFTLPEYRVGSDMYSGRFNGRLGAVWFNTSYIDLSVAANLAKFVSGTGINAKPVDLGATGELPTGTAPLIYLPMYGNNAGKNYGTGGDFTVNSGPYTGARGPNEFWGNKAIFNGSSSKITRSTMSGVSASSTVSGCFWIRVVNFPASQAGVLYGAYGLRILVSSSTSQPLTFSATNSSGSIILSVQTNTTTFSTTPYYCVQYCFDMTNSAKRFVYINDVSQSLIVSTYTNANIAHNLMAPIIGWNNSSGYLDGGLAEMYMTTEYIDFSLESNRLKFRDAFGYPVDLSAQITAAAIPTPAIYMRFPPTSFGTNSGTGGDFTVNGTITDGGQL